MTIWHKSSDDPLPWEPGYGFLSSDKLALAAALEAVRRRMCAYGAVGDQTCDCKYGISKPILAETVRGQRGNYRVGGEDTGCPELRSVIYMLLHEPEEA